MSDAPRTRWRYAKKGNKIFVYLGMAMTPSFTFVKDTKSGAYKGHKLYFYSMITIKNHIDVHGMHMLRKEAA